MDVAISDHHHVRVFRLAGRFDATAAPDAQTAFERSMDAPPQAVVLDFADVEYISSGGIRAVIVLSRLCQQCQAPLRLAGMNPFVKQVFDLSNLSQIFDIYPTSEDAIAAAQTS